MYFVSDFDNMKIDYLDSVLDTGRVSIKASLRFDMLPTGKITVEPTLYLKARNIGHDEVDLVSFQTTCASLEENGCHFSFDERPSGGVRHIPRKTNGYLDCYSEFDVREEVDKYILVKRKKEKNVYEKLKEEIEKLLKKIITQDFEDVVEEERGAFNSIWGLLIHAYPEQYQNAVNKIATMNIMKRQLVSKK